VGGGLATCVFGSPSHLVIFELWGARIGGRHKGSQGEKTEGSACDCFAWRRKVPMVEGRHRANGGGRRSPRGVRGIGATVFQRYLERWPRCRWGVATPSAGGEVRRQSRCHRRRLSSLGRESSEGDRGKRWGGETLLKRRSPLANGRQGGANNNVGKKKLYSLESSFRKRTHGKVYLGTPHPCDV